MKTPEQLQDARQKRALVAGSFDPISLGHMSLVDYAARTFGEVEVVLFVNAEKEYFFTAEQRLRLIEAACSRYENVKTGSSDGMLYLYAKDHQIDFTVRGYRNEFDLIYEQKMAQFNENALPGFETLLVKSRPDQRFISSTKIRELLRNNGDFAPFVPSETVDLLRSFVKENSLQKM